MEVKKRITASTKQKGANVTWEKKKKKENAIKMLLACDHTVRDW